MATVRVTDLAETWVEVAAFTTAVEAKLGRWLTDTYGVGLSEFRAMVHLGASPTKELRVNELAQRSGLNQSSMTRLLTRLEAKSLTYRDTCPDDGRGVFAVISEDGEALLHEMQAAHDARLRELLTEPDRHFPDLAASASGRAFRAVSDLLLGR